MAKTNSSRSHSRNAKKSPASELQTLLSDLRTDLARVKDAALGAGFDKVGELKDASGEALESRKEQVLDLAERLGDVIRSRPFRAVAIAAGAGLLYGMLRRRR